MHYMLLKHFNDCLLKTRSVGYIKASKKAFPPFRPFVRPSVAHLLWCLGECKCYTFVDLDDEDIDHQTNSPSTSVSSLHPVLLTPAAKQYWHRLAGLEAHATPVDNESLLCRISPIRPTHGAHYVRPG